MIKLGGGYWEDGLEALKDLPISAEDADEKEEEEWEKEASTALETLGGVNVDDG